MKKKTITSKMIGAFESGEALTQGQIRSRFRAKNPRAMVSYIYLHKKLDVILQPFQTKAGKTTYKYALV